MHWISQNGYLLLFAAMLIEGPVVTAAGAFLAGIDFFNLWIVAILSIFGNLIPDIAYYALGYWGRGKFIDTYGRYFGLDAKKILYLEELIQKHAVKSLFVIKLVPLLATPGLIIVGFIRMNLKKYIKWSLIITVVSSGFYLIVGYYFGAAYDRIAHYVNAGGLLAVIFIILFLVVLYFGKKLSEKFAKKIIE